MTSARLDAQRTALQCALNAITRRREGLEIEREADALDNAIAISERDTEAILLDRERQRELAILAALDRIEDGTYGKCSDCHREISTGRLAALPWAARCIFCTDIIEREEAA